MKSAIEYMLEMIRSVATAAMIVVLIFAAAWLGWMSRAATPSDLILATERTSKLPTIEDIQRRVGVVRDGKLGSETQAKWDRALCDQFAAESLRKDRAPGSRNE